MEWTIISILLVLPFLSKAQFDCTSAGGQCKSNNKPCSGYYNSSSFYSCQSIRQQCCTTACTALGGNCQTGTCNGGSTYNNAFRCPKKQQCCLPVFNCPAGDTAIIPCSSDGDCSSGDFCFAHSRCCTGTRGPCINNLEEVLLTTPVRNVGRFIPTCRLDGYCSPVQCWGSTGYCWCSEPDSLNCSEIPGTSVRGNPNCT